MNRARRGLGPITAVLAVSLAATATLLVAPAIAQTLPARMALINAASDAAANEAAEPERPPIKFRRVFVPADAPQSWPTDGEQYLPLDRAEFEQLVAAAEDAQQPGGHARPRIAEAEYRASLADGDALVGSSTLRIEQPAPTRSLLPLAPLSMAVTGASWASTPERPPLLGAWARPGSAALEYAVAVDESDRLRLEWTAPLQSSAGKQLHYLLRLPRVATQRFELELPPNYAASIEPSHLESNAPSSVGGTTTWKFRLPAAAEHRVRIQRADSAGADQASLPLVAVAEDYRLSADGLDYEAEWRIEPRGPLDEMQFEIPGEMEIIEVHADREPSTWQRATAIEGAHAGRAVVPLSATAGPHTVRIKAAAPLTLDQPWTLPRIKAADAFWTEGTAALLVDAALELSGVATRNASLVNVLGVGAASAGEAYRVQQYSADAPIEAVVGRREPIVVGQSGVAVEFADRELVTRSTIRLWPEQGRTFDLFAVIQRHWNVEAVSATPSGVLSTWHVEQRANERRLRLELRRWPANGEPIMITVDGRKRTSRPIASATMDSLAWLRLSEIRMTSELLAVRDRRGNKIVPTSAVVDDVIDVAALSAEDRQLIGDAPGAVVLATAAADPAARVRIVSRTAQFEADARVQLIRTATGFEHRVDMACRPTVGALDETLVTFARPLPADAAWQIDAPGGQLIVARVNGTVPDETLLTASSEPGVAASAVTYRVQFGKPVTEPFNLRVAWRGEKQQSDSINAVTMPGADAWHSWAILRADPRQVLIRANGYPPAAAQPPEDLQAPSAPIVACFRLSSDTASPPDETPTMEAIATTGSTAGSTSFCRFANLVTLAGADGGQIQEASYELVTRGAEQATFDLPAGVEIDEARIDGVAAALERSAEAPRRCRIRLPRDRGELELVLRMHAQAPPLDSGAAVAPPWPAASFAILRGRWTVAVPPRYAFAASAAESADGDWFARLFGPLARRGEEGAWRLPVTFGAISGAGQVKAAPTEASAADRAETGLGVPRGWISDSQEFSLAPEPRRVHSVDDHRADWYALWLASAAAAAWLAGRRLRWTALAAVMAAVACLVMPPMAASLAQSVFLGILTGLMVRTAIVGMPRPATRSARSALTAFTLFVVGWTSFGAAEVRAAEAAPAAPPSVLIPIDADRQPQGDDVYVPAKLLAEWRAASAAASVESAAAAITSARYELTLENQTAQGEVDSRSGVVILRCETMQRGAPLTLPLRKDDAQWLDARHTLDGRPVALVWSQDGKSAVVQLADAGSSELRIQFTPRAISVADRRQTSIRVPAIPGAVVEVKHPFGLRNVAVEGAAVSAQQTNASRTLARLGAAEGLTVSWPAIAERAASQAIGVEQFSWLHVERASAYLDVRLRVDGDAAPLEKLELAIAPQLRLEPLGQDSPIQSVETTPGSPALLKLKFRSLERLPLTLALRFQVQRTVSLGHVAYPNVRVLRAATRRSHFAVSADPRLRTLDEPTSGLAPITAAEVDELWGSAPAKPLAQYAVTADEPQWSLAVEQAPPQFVADETLDLLCQAAEARFQYVGSVEEIDGALLLHEFIVSPQAKVEEVVVSDQLAGEPMTSRWTRPTPDRLCVFLGAPLAAGHTVEIVGSVPYDDASRLPIPRVAIQRSRATTSELVVRRTSDAAVAWSGEGEPAAVLPARDDGASSALVVGRYALPPAGAALGVLDVTRNDVEWGADALVTLDLSAAEPVAQVAISAVVASGALDRIRLMTSLDWQGPFEAADAEAVVSEIPAEGRQLIEIRLAEPIVPGERRVIRLSGKMSLAADQRVRMPQVRLLGAATPRTFVALPPTVAGQTSNWTLAGLRREELPSPLQKAPEAVAAGAAYLALREHYVAEQRVFPHMMREPESRLAATHGAIDAEGVLSAVAELIVQPGSADRFAVRLPPGAELLAAAVNDVPVVDLRMTDGVWQSPVGVPYLPRIVTISYRQQLSAGGRGYQFDAAKAVVAGRELDAAETLWQVESDPRTHYEIVAGTSVPQANFEGLRQRQLVAAATEASPLAFQLPQWEARAWFAPWLRRLPATADAGSPWAKLREQPVAARSLPPAPSADGEGAQPRLAIEPQAAAWYQAGKDGSLVMAPQSDWSWAFRWLAAVTIIAAVAAVVGRPEWFTPVIEAVRRWPHAAVALGGLFWWLTLSPSALGLAVVALAAASFLRSRWGAAKRAPADRGSVIATGVG